MLKYFIINTIKMNSFFKGLGFFKDSYQLVHLNNIQAVITLSKYYKSLLNSSKKDANKISATLNDSFWK